MDYAAIQRATAALYKATADKDHAAMREAIAAGAVVNAPHDPHRYSRTLVEQAAMNGDAEALRILIAAGADTRAARSGGEGPLYYAVHYGHVEAARVLLKAGAYGGPIRLGVGVLSMLHIAKTPEIVEALLESKGFDVNYAPKVGGQTALMLAADRGDIRSMELLIQAGAETWRTDANGNTARQRAVLCRRHEAAAWLENLELRDALEWKTRPAAEAKGSSRSKSL